MLFKGGNTRGENNQVYFHHVWLRQNHGKISLLYTIQMILKSQAKKQKMNSKILILRGRDNHVPGLFGILQSV